MTTSDAVEERRQLNTVDHLLSGVEAGVFMVFLTNPLWLIKTRLQIQHNPLQSRVSESVECHTRTATESGGSAGVTRYKGPFGESLYTCTHVHN
jgi:hypothetical protein